MADSNPRALFRYVAERLNDLKLAYLHVIEPRVKGGEVIAEGQGPVAAQELSKVFRGPIIAAGGFEPGTAEATVVNGDASLIAFGRHFIANPELPKRIELGLPLIIATTGARSTLSMRTATPTTPNMRCMNRKRPTSPERP